MPELERRKKELAAKRELFTPISHEEMDTHIQKYNQIKKFKEMERE
jgi:hypothetical protein